jgi:hypothetical protein
LQRGVLVTKGGKVAGHHLGPLTAQQDASRYGTSFALSRRAFQYNRGNYMALMGGAGLHHVICYPTHRCDCAAS